METENFIEMKRRLLEEGKIGLAYQLADPIKNTGFFWNPKYPLLQRQSFSDTTQMLGYFSKHQEYLGYINTEPIDLHSALGLTLMRPMSDEDANALFTGEDAKALLKCQVLPGIQTSLIRAYRSKLGDFPANLEQLKLSPKQKKEFAEIERDNAAIYLFSASHLLPYVQDHTDLSFHAITFFYSQYNTPEKIRKFWEKSYRNRLKKCRDDEERNWLKERMGSETEFVESEIKGINLWKGEERIAIRTLESIAEESLRFVREFAPEEYERFSRAISK